MRTRIYILETESELKRLLSQETDGRIKEKLQALYWLKTKKLYTIIQIADLLGCHRVTVQRWIGEYRQHGIEAILKRKKSPGRPRLVPPEIVNKLEIELTEPEGFFSYGEVQQWLQVFYDLKVKYRTVHQLVRYRLKSKLKVPRPVNIKQNPEAFKEFKKNLSSKSQTK